MLLNRAALLQFFDDKPNGEGRPYGQTFGAGVSAVTALVGEELVLDLFQHYWQRHKRPCGNLRRLDDPCRAAEGQRRLDAWFVRSRDGKNLDLFKAEAKNWSYHSVNMKRPLTLDARPEEVKRVAGLNWNACIERNRCEPKLRKVMDAMRNPQGVTAGLDQQPLLCIWAPVLPSDGTSLKPFFQFRKRNHPLNGLWVFSASVYLRQLNDRTVRLPLQGSAHRIRLLRNLGIEMNPAAT